jgi:hypothetical protein
MLLFLSLNLLCCCIQSRRYRCENCQVEANLQEKVQMIKKKKMEFGVRVGKVGLTA